MTNEQIKQRAEEYTNSMRLSTENPPSDYHIGIYDGYIVGAHSRDGDVGTIEGLLKIKEHEIKQLRAELEEAKNPWVSVKERLPECQFNQDIPYHRIRSSKDVLCATNGKLRGKAYYSYARMQWEWNEGAIEHVTHWMPIPQAPKGGNV